MGEHAECRERLQAGPEELQTAIRRVDLDGGEIRGRSAQAVSFDFIMDGEEPGALRRQEIRRAIGAKADGSVLIVGSGSR